jgi:hypothetical protein
MSLTRVFAIGGPLDKFLLVLVASAIALIVMSLGQGFVWQWLDVSNAGDPIAAVNRFGSLSIWVVHPFAALFAGAIVSRISLSLGIALFATAVSLAPLWMVWLSTDISLERASSAVVCMGAASLPVVLRHSALIPARGDKQPPS